MQFILGIQSFVQSLDLTALTSVSIMVFGGFFLGRAVKHIKLPSIIGFMLMGVLLGPSLAGLLDEGFQNNLSFITDMALSFVAVSIGLELSFSSLRKQGAGIVTVILTESFLAFAAVTALLYLLTRDMPLALLFGAIAPASAPAGTVAIIHEYKARGPLTKALYSVVGFDDGLGIIIFGFALAFAKSMLASEIGMETTSLFHLILDPLREVVFSVIIGGLAAALYMILGRRLNTKNDLFILLFAFTLLNAGLSQMFHLSLILTNMVMGIVLVNSRNHKLVEQIHDRLSSYMPLLFVLFFVLAGANLHLGALPSLGLIGIVYIFGRALGLVSGARIGAGIGKLPPSIRKYLGMGILSQAGVAIGLSLIVKNELAQFGEHGLWIGSTIITTVTAASLFFELIGPILTKKALEKAGEISPPAATAKVRE